MYESGIKGFLSCTRSPMYERKMIVVAPDLIFRIQICGNQELKTVSIYLYPAFIDSKLL